MDFQVGYTIELLIEKGEVFKLTVLRFDTMAGPSLPSRWT